MPLVTTSLNEDILRYRRLFLLRAPSHLPFRKTNISHSADPGRRARCGRATRNNIFPLSRLSVLPCARAVYCDNISLFEDISRSHCLKERKLGRNIFFIFFFTLHNASRDKYIWNFGGAVRDELDELRDHREISIDRPTRDYRVPSSREMKIFESSVTPSRARTVRPARELGRMMKRRKCQRARGKYF